MTTQDKILFTDVVWDYYAHHGRDLPWRHLEADTKEVGYKVLVSELMLQQTQVNRVIEKYQQWMDKLPTIDDVARSSLAELLQLWSGLGYNRRAKYLQQACQWLCTHTDGMPPNDIEVLRQLKGIGPNTAAAILVYTFNQPHIFIETNVRTVYIHHFFNDAQNVSDVELMPYIADTVDKEQPREWYWALMDYGSFLKKEYGNVAQRSSVYKPQPQFKGSQRQLRGLVIKQLLDGPKTTSELMAMCADDACLPKVVSSLESEGLIVKTGVKYKLSDK